MKISRRRALVASLGVLPAVGILEALGQDVRQGTITGMDVLMGPWLLADGVRQISVSQLALKTSKAEQVKEFALAEINEHKELKTRLERMGFRAAAPLGAAPGTLPPHSREPGATLPGATPPGAEPGATPPRTPPRTGAPATPPPSPPLDRTPPDRPPLGSTREPGTRPQTRPEAAPATDAAAASPLLRVASLKQELAEQCAATLRRELSRREGADFDRAYIGDQLSAHYELLDTVLVFQRHAGAEMRRALATDAQPIIEKHITWLQRIMRGLAG